jgi:lipid A disaccharide synthetase
MQTVKRSFSTNNQKHVCILANSRQADLTASKLMNKLREVSGEPDSLTFSGYGGPWMAKEGFEPTVEIDIDQLMDKTFVTYRKTKTFSEDLMWRWNPMNLVNKHYTRSTDQMHDKLLQADLSKKIYQSRPDLILNVDNEYMTFMLMDEIKKYYKNSAVDMPQRHYLNRFVRDFRQWTEKYVDYMHYTVPLTCGTGDNYQFPGEYIGQYGVYEAVKHIYN